MPGYDPARLAAAVKADALRLGFDGVGIARAERLDAEARRLEAWLTAGRHGGASGAMPWMEGHFDKRIDPRELVPGAQSVVSVFASYWQDAPAAPAASGPDATARIARYAWGDDYHEVASAMSPAAADPITTPT